jgi:hypothetical protein
MECKDGLNLRNSGMSRSHAQFHRNAANVEGKDTEARKRIPTGERADPKRLRARKQKHSRNSVQLVSVPGE